jgi:2-amino-4-hydroxy-6-hydroxymethyldihydropteridine diphosphokinase
MGTTDHNGSSAQVYLSVGSNIAPESNLRLACRELSDAFGRLELSNVYRNPAEGFDGAEFLNMVIGFRTDKAPEQIVARLEDIHAKANRKRQANRFSSRTLDLDLLLYGSIVKRSLKLPHADIEKYSFVAKPLADIAPDRRHPVTGLTMKEIWDNFEQDQHPLEEVELQLPQ